MQVTTLCGQCILYVAYQSAPHINEMKVPWSSSAHLLLFAMRPVLQQAVHLQY